VSDKSVDHLASTNTNSNNAARHLRLSRWNNISLYRVAQTS